MSTIAVQNVATKPSVEIKAGMLPELLGNLRAAQFAAVEYESEPGNVKSPKTSGMAGRIKKRCRVNPIVGTALSYLSVVNRRLTAEGKEPVDQVKPRQWGERVIGTPFVSHKGQLYLECLVEKCHEVTWFLDGAEIAYDVVKPFLRPAPPKSNLYDLADEDIPCWRDIRLDHILSVSMDGCRYVVVP
jgi:hypothetical protein